MSLHYGPFETLVWALRAHGHACAVIIGTDRGLTPVLTPWIDKLAGKRLGHADAPAWIPADDVWEAREHLRSVGPLVVLLDGGSNRPEVESGRFRARLETRGALRLAEIAGADIVPCVVRAEGGMSIVVELAEPLPRELVKHRERHGAAYSSLLGTLIDLVARAPAQSRKRLVRSLRVEATG